jgi:hypothetical protein
MNMAQSLVLMCREELWGSGIEDSHAYMMMFVQIYRIVIK